MKHSRGSNIRTLNTHTPLGYMVGGLCNGWRWRTIQAARRCGVCRTNIHVPGRAWVKGEGFAAVYLCGGCSEHVKGIV